MHENQLIYLKINLCKHLSHNVMIDNIARSKTFFTKLTNSDCKTS